MASPDAAISEVKRLYAVAQAKIAATPENLTSKLSFGFFSDDDQAAEKKNLAGDEERITTWSTTYRKWAEAGQRDDGTAYDWTRWFDFGAVLASDINAQAQDAVDADVFIADAQATAATAQQVADTAVKAAQVIGGALIKPWVWIAAGGLVVVGIGAYAWRTFVPRASP